MDGPSSDEYWYALCRADADAKRSGMPVFPRRCRRRVAPKASLSIVRLTLCFRITIAIVAAQLFFILPIEPGEPSVNLFQVDVLTFDEDFAKNSIIPVSFLTLQRDVLPEKQIVKMLT